MWRGFFNNFVDFRDVDQAFEAIFYLYEDAEVHHAGNFAVDGVAHGVVGDELFLLLIIQPLLAENEFSLFGLCTDDADSKFGTHQLAQLLGFSLDGLHPVVHVEHLPFAGQFARHHQRHAIQLGHVVVDRKSVV